MRTVKIVRNGQLEGIMQIDLVRTLFMEGKFSTEGIDKIPFIELFRQELSQTTDRYFYSQAKARGGYLNMGEIVHDAGEGDPDAQFLLKLYDAIWEKEEELENQIDSMSLEELLNLNIEAWVKPLYDQIVAELENAADSTTNNTSEG